MRRKTIKLEDVNQLLDPGYMTMETGFTRLPNNAMYVAVLTRMPQCKGEMIDWWFGYAGDTEKYKLWHPHDHLVGDWDEHWSPGHYIGASHLVHEYIGDEIAKNFRQLERESASQIFSSVNKIKPSERFFSDYSINFVRNRSSASPV